MHMLLTGTDPCSSKLSKNIQVKKDNHLFLFCSKYQKTLEKIKGRFSEEIGVYLK